MAENRKHVMYAEWSCAHFGTLCPAGSPPLGMLRAGFELPLAFVGNAR